MQCLDRGQWSILSLPRNAELVVEGAAIQVFVHRGNAYQGMQDAYNPMLQVGAMNEDLYGRTRMP